GGVVVQGGGRAGGAALGIQRTADGEVAVAVDQRAVAVAQRLHADVQALARRDGGRAHAAVHRLGKVVEGGCGDGHVIAIDAAGTDVVNGIGVDAGLTQAVDQAPVGERAGVHAGVGTAHLAGGGVVHDVAA